MSDGAPKKAALLGVSSMVQTFCQANHDCYQMEEIQFIITQYERLLNDNCYAHGQEEEVIYSAHWIYKPPSVVRVAAAIASAAALSRGWI